MDYHDGDVENAGDGNDRSVAKRRDLAHQGRRQNDEDGGNHEKPGAL